MRSTKRLFSILICIVCLFALCTTALAADASITAMKTDCLIDGTGSCQVTQSVTINIGGIENELRFPLGPNAKQASIAGYKARKVNEDGYTVLVLTNEAGFSGSRTFTLNYTLEDLVTEQDEVQTLTLPLLSPKWPWQIESFDFTVTLPAEFTDSPDFSSGYYGDVIEEYMSVSTVGTVVGGSVMEPLKDRESLQMTLSLPKGYFSGSYVSWSANWFASILVVVLALLAVVYYLRTLYSGRMRTGSRATPPEATLPCDMPYLLACKKPSFNMLICHWASLGYLTIAVSKRGNVQLRRRVIMGNERRAIEVRLFGALFADGDVCDGASLRYKKTAAKAMDAIPRFWHRRLYDKRSGNVLVMQALACLAAAIAFLLSMSLLLPAMPARWLLLILCVPAGAALGRLMQLAASTYYLSDYLMLAMGVLSGLLMLIVSRLGGGTLTVLVAVVLNVFTGVATRHGGKRTASGNKLVAQAIGFRRYLRRAGGNHLIAAQKRDGQFFYKLLPYAEAMGMGAVFAKKFGDTTIDSCDWYETAEPLPKTAEGFYGHLRQTLSLLDMSIRK
ncbi:MAG: DUF2207 domain-containing protein [Clostridiales bacterium]|nr:DUF2207 domain-containing protein [Clostridiales bacterium]